MSNLRIVLGPFVKNPFFSICIPQYNRTSFLIEALKTLAAQTFRGFEICISDDCSTDGREQELLDFLRCSGMSFVYRKQRRNERYDGNLRTSISMARGRFCFLLGNDDALSSPETLEETRQDIQSFGAVGVAITNYEDFSSGRKFDRVQGTGLKGSGPQVAVNHFRNLSFVSGIALDAAKAKKYATKRWDGSEMYQVFVACRIIASGGSLLTIRRATVRSGIQIPGETVDSYARRPKLNALPVAERKIPLVLLGQLVADAIGPYARSLDKPRLIENIQLQIFSFTYPFWVVEYRRVQSWPYAFGICLGMRPDKMLGNLNLPVIRKIRVWLVYGLVSLLGLIIPIGLFGALQPQLYSVAKKRWR